MLPEFLPGRCARLLAVRHAPAPGVALRGAVLCFVPFAEEMNKSRRMLTLAARRLAADGWGVLIVDPHGTGDSGGDFVDARWDIWQDDYAACARWLQARHPGRLVLWGVRTGALLAAELAGSAALAVDTLLYWQPVTVGDLALTQFLRLRLAAGLMDGSKETAAGLRERLNAGESLEIAGYELHPALAAALERSRLLPPPAGVPVLWLELVSEAGRAPGAVAQKLLAGWRSDGHELRCETVVGDSFWATQEIAVVPALVEATAAMLAGVALPAGAGA
ncbi:MAG TPA: hydrolase 2, exosortase A system-associated [Plasticicumulans sp.]|uniref:hydrolase 2, exosortase A system-associated n=1 Tax=Plasticicumulans sp. TaxID=2307179 RepID=UPI002C7C38B4|nr:hydrolase 2, exosortase A system-associated [Plasticicumulans sp.]HNG49806.1 hydrolase 2, exosortase A system-associated [Plasticicumulans sp.]